MRRFIVSLTLIASMLAALSTAAPAAETNAGSGSAGGGWNSNSCAIDSGAFNMAQDMLNEYLFNAEDDPFGIVAEIWYQEVMYWGAAVERDCYQSPS